MVDIRPDLDTDRASSIGATPPVGDGARAADRMASVTAASRLIHDAFAGVVIGGGGMVQALPDLPGSALLAARSDLLDVIRERFLTVGLPSSFLWPHDGPAAPHDYVRVTSIVLGSSAAPGVRAIVLLSPSDDLHGLTRRELEVLGFIVDGDSNDQIAHALVVTTRTVATHVEHILAKLSSPSRTHAAVRAQREGLYVPASAAPCP
jgi:DNA-binding CsgD family transcriptional regulator